MRSDVSGSQIICSGREKIWSSGRSFPWPTSKSHCAKCAKCALCASFGSTHMFLVRWRILICLQIRLLDASSNYVLLCAFPDHRQCLLKVASKCHSDSTKREIRLIQKVSRSPVNGLYSKPMLHRDLIPDDKTGLLEKLSSFRVLLKKDNEASSRAMGIPSTL